MFTPLSSLPPPILSISQKYYMSLVSFATSKRSSCDRCRKQKLRCPTKEDATQSCARCLRAGATCVMSYTRPRGRSQKDAISLHEEDTRKSSDSNSALLSPRNLLSSGSEHTTESTSAQSWSLLNEYEFYPSLPSSYGLEQTQTQDAGSASMHYSSLYRELGIDTHIETPHLLQDALPSVAAAELASPDTVGPDFHAASKSTPELMRHLECEMRLSQLNLDLCRQLQAQVLSPDWCAEVAVQARTSNTSNALRDILQSTEMYIHVLQSLSASKGDSGSPGLLPSDWPAPCFPLTLPCMLNLTSCLFYIVDLFNAFLGNLAKEFQTHHLGSPSSHSQILPEVMLVGLPVQEASLQVKILSLVISHHFETMERLLGLPVELRLSLQPDTGTRELLPAQWITTILSGKGELFGMDGDRYSNYLQTIGTLRRTICRLQRTFQ